MRHTAELFSDHLIKSLVLLHIVIKAAVCHPVILLQETAPVFGRDHIRDRCYKNAVIPDTIAAGLTVLEPAIVGVSIRIGVIAILIFQISAGCSVVIVIVQDFAVAQVEIDRIAVIAAAERQSIGIGNIDISV